VNCVQSCGDRRFGIPPEGGTPDQGILMLLPRKRTLHARRARERKWKNLEIKRAAQRPKGYMVG
jgi:hypothetical protein